MADQREIPADTPEGLKAYLLRLEARVAELEKSVYKWEDAYQKVEDTQRSQWGI